MCSELSSLNKTDVYNPGILQKKKNKSREKVRFEKRIIESLK